MSGISIFKKKVAHGELDDSITDLKQSITLNSFIPSEIARNLSHVFG